MQSNIPMLRGFTFFTDAAVSQKCLLSILLALCALSTLQADDLAGKQKPRRVSNRRPTETPIAVAHENRQILEGSVQDEDSEESEIRAAEITDAEEASPVYVAKSNRLESEENIDAENEVDSASFQQDNLYESNVGATHDVVSEEMYAGDSYEEDYGQGFENSCPGDIVSGCCGGCWLDHSCAAQMLRRRFAHPCRVRFLLG